MALMASRWGRLLLLGQTLRTVYPLPRATCLMSSPVRFFHATAVSCRFSVSKNGPTRGKKGEVINGSSWSARDTEEEEEEEDEDEQSMEDEELLESGLPPLPLEAQRIFIVHPAVKWGASKPQLTTAELQLAEAVALINTIPNWTVVDKLILSTKNPDKKFIFGKGNFQLLTGETFVEIQLRLLKEKEFKIRKALERLRRKRCLLRNQRQKREFPTVSVMGYTNCGKTTLIKALTGDAGLQPRDQLFATLDITAHAGYLPSNLTVLYVDTIGFLSQLPHDLVESFSATLEDVALSDLIIHVRDVSHPETELQRESVLSVLRNLNISSHLLESIIEVHNKVDLIDRYIPANPNSIAISALLGYGLEELKEEIDRRLLTITGKNFLIIKINLSGPQLSWLYKEATVQEVGVAADDGTANVKVIISNSALGKYRKLFPRSTYSSQN
ncbi:putative GTP-binding protein 6 isoform X2 [Varanus komodoensis]|uniref:putative GTP-binding protein 6 isoform X2 n=1 Tax=Varanus komodoensis TaxID=61221 RepID=UPI001CF78541|nr:putative GTP-binding protein 6 isoform X2 [Varanus komodoensis]